MQIERCIPQTIVDLYDFSSVPSTHLTTVKHHLVTHYNAKTLEHFAAAGTFINPLRLYLDIPTRLAQLRQTHPDLFDVSPSTLPTKSDNLVKLDNPGCSSNPVNPTSPVNPGSPVTPSKPETPLSPTVAMIPSSSPTGLSTNIPEKLKELFATTTSDVRSRDPSRAQEKPERLENSNRLEKVDKGEMSVSQTLKNPTVLRQFVEFVQSHYEPSPEPKVKFMDLLKDFHESTGIYLGDRWNSKYENLCQTIGIRVEKVAGTGYYKGGTYYAYLRLKLPTIGPIPTLFIPPMATTT
jgi:hypothetical protein